MLGGGRDRCNRNVEVVVMMIKKAGEGGWIRMLWFVWGATTVVNNGAEPWIFFSESPKRRLSRLGESTQLTG